MATPDDPTSHGATMAENPTAQAAGMRPARPTLRDVAALAGVSTATASQALRGGPVKASTGQSVRDAAAKLRYVPQASGQTLRTGQARIVGLWILNRPDAPELTEACAFFYPLIRGAMDALETAGYGLLFSAISGSASALTERLATAAASGSPAGFIIIPQWSGHDGFAKTLADLGTPVVPVNARIAGCLTSDVTVDQACGITHLVTHLTDLGHEQIGYLAGPAGHNDADARLEAFYRAAAALGLRVPAFLVHRVPFTIAGGETGLGTLLRAAKAAGAPAPTAVLAADDYVAAGALRHAASIGLAIPADLSIVGFDDVDVARVTVPALTTVRQPLRDLGYVAAEQVLRLLDGRRPERVELPVSLVVRDSSAPIRRSRR